MNETWHTAPLGSLTQFTNGLWKGEEPPFVRVGVIRNTNFAKDGTLDDADIAYLDVETKKYAKRRLQFGDLILEKSGGGPKQPVGRVVYFDKADGDFSFSNFTAAIRVIDPAVLNAKYLHKYLHWVYIAGHTEAMQSHSTGIRNLNGDAYKSIEIAYPALSEQQRIVAILDEAFKGIATAKASAEANLQNTKKLVAALSEELFKDSSDLGANDQTLAELCEFIVDCEHKTAPTQDEGIPSIRTPNIGAGRLILDGVYRVSEETYKEWTRRAEPKPGDLILAREAPAGNVAVIPDGTRVCLGQRTVLIRPKASVFDSTYLAHLLLCASSQKRLLAHSRGATVQHINMKDIRAFKVHVVPPLDDQRRIVKKLSALIEQGELLARTQSRKLAALEELKKSLLHQAFTGQLKSSEKMRIAQPPELQTATPTFTANVISIAYARHERLKKEKTFGRVKEQKTLHLVESIAGIDLGRQPMRDAAGPNDFPHMLKAEEWAKAHGFFEMVKTGEGYEFRKLSRFDEHMSRAHQALAPYLSRLEPVIDLLVPMDTEEAEVFTTVHAAWNNLLTDGVQATDDAIVLASRQEWHPNKLKIPEHKFRSAIEKIRKKKVVPEGLGKYVGGQKALFDESFHPAQQH